MNDVIKHKIKHNAHRTLVSIKWVIFAIIVGGIVGLCGTAFYFCLTFVTVLRGQDPWLLYLLPVGGLIIVGAYHLLHDEKDTGTNLVISAIHSDDELPLRMAPLIFISTLITHLFGGSAGREGAALQMGGSIGNAIGKFFRFDDKDKHVMIMCGMSAAFSALFGTPMAAAILPMEIVSVGVMYYTALVPCVISSLVAHGVAYLFGVSNQWFSIEHIPDFGILPAVQISILAVLCALVSIVFCVLLHKSEEIYRKLFQNPYIRIFAGGCIVVILTMLVGNQNYNGTGIGIIQIDEPALREGLPLKRSDWDAYLQWGVEAFRINAAVARDDTQIHTHMCYCEFNDIMDSIAALDADVITIETSRSDMELLESFEEFDYPNEIGPGVYDIHSPNVPSVEWIESLLKKAAQRIPAERLWVNPDCGLKTRGWPETRAALANMVKAAQNLRQA